MDKESKMTIEKFCSRPRAAFILRWSAATKILDASEIVAGATWAA
jgi:hypothetical protein